MRAQNAHFIWACTYNTLKVLLTKAYIHCCFCSLFYAGYPTCIAYLTITADYENTAEQDCWNTFIITKLFFFQLIFCLWHSSSGSCDDVFY